MFRRAPRNRRGNRRRPNQNRGTPRSLRGYINGGKRRIGCNPKPITYDPWNSLSLQFKVDSNKDTNINYTIKDIDTRIRTQLDLPPAAYYDSASSTTPQKFFLCFKLISVSVHDLNGEPVGMEIYDPSNLRTSQSGELSIPFNTVWDYPGRNSWASCRVVYPAFMQRTPIMYYDEMSGGQVMFTTIGQDKNFSHLVTVKLLWKSAMELGEKIRTLKPNSAVHNQVPEIDNSITALGG